MTMTIDRKTVALVLVALVLGWWLGSSPKSPVNPNPQRPVLHALARVTRTAARLGLWFAMAADPPPAEAKPEPEDRQQLVRAGEIGADGHPRVHHARGW